MNIDTFKQNLLADGFCEITTVERPAGYSLGVHDHPFDAKALIMQGDITLVVNGVSTRYAVGDVFELAAHTLHEEHAIANGVTYWVGRKV